MSLACVEDLRVRYAVNNDDLKTIGVILPDQALEASVQLLGMAAARNND
jgi:hypothetical protein